MIIAKLQDSWVYYARMQIRVGTGVINTFNTAIMNVHVTTSGTYIHTTYVYARTHMSHAHIRMFMYVYMDVCMQVCVCVCVYLCVCMLVGVRARRSKSE